MQSVSYWLFVCILFFCPLAFGTVELWSLSVMELLVPLALLALLFGNRGRHKWYSVPGLLPLSCFLGYLAFQALPLPPLIVKALSPEAYTVYEPAIKLHQGNLFLPLTLNPKATATEFFRISTYACFYVLTIQILSDYSRLRKTLFLVLGLAGSISFFAILQKFSSPNLIYWFRPVPANAMPIGPWVYHNHFAGFMEMLLPVAVAFFLHYRPHIHYEMPWREKLLSIFTLPRSNLHVLLGFCAFLIAVSIFISISRGAIISASLSLFILILLLTQLGQMRRGIMFASFAVLILILAVAWFGWQPILKRFDLMLTAEGRIFDSRFLIWRDSLPLIKDFPLFGAGFGTYVHTFPLYRHLFIHPTIIDHAHNDYIELLAEGGIVGFLLAAWFLFALLRASWLRMKTRRDSSSPLLYYGVFCGILAILLHGITDFNMHNGANGLYFFFLCGLLVGAANTRRQGRNRKSFLPERSLPLVKLGIPVVLVAAAALSFNLGQAFAFFHFQPLANSYLNLNIPADRLLAWRDSVTKAATADPLEARYPFARANIETFLNDFASARSDYVKALRLNPTEPDYLLRTGLYMESVDAVISDMLLNAASRIEQHPKTYKAHASQLLRAGRIDDGLAQLRKALDLEPDRFLEYIPLLLVHDIDFSAMEHILPERVQPYLGFASYLAEQGELETAGHYYRQALLQLDKEEEIHSWFFLAPSRFFMKTKQYDEALAVLRQGIERLPANDELRLRTGDIYLLLGIGYRAREEYRQALVINPGNQEAIKRLEQMSHQP